jgi:hypothetical protein
VVPPGAVRLSDNGTDRWEVVADGGYYDNFGAATLLDVLDALGRLAAPRDGKKLHELVRPVVLLITSDPTRGMAEELDAAFQDDRFSLIEDCRLRSPNRLRNDKPPLWKRALMTADERQLYELEELFSQADPQEPAGPLGTLMKARGRSGSSFPLTLRTRVKELGGEYFHFAMDDTVSAPLGWALSEKARTDLNKLLKSDCHETQLHMIIQELRKN